jgi:predicted alpha/beta hydrolase family esterase
MAFAFPAPRSYSPPPLRLLAREGVSYAYMRLTASFGTVAPVTQRGNGQRVLVIPGFMASDVATSRLRNSLNASGFETFGWALGRNTGVAADIFEKLDARLDAIGGDGPITLVGWSLGGLIAREYAKHAPHRVAKVITLGSPFSGDLRCNNAWRLYEFVAGYKIDNPPIAMVLGEKPPVPTVAFWSARDGVVASQSACGLPGESDIQHELDCTHMAFVARPEAINAIAKAIVT